MIYFDNAETSYPKSEAVYECMDHANRMFNFSRGKEYGVSRHASQIIETTKASLKGLVHGNAYNVVLFNSADFVWNSIIGELRLAVESIIYVSPFESGSVKYALNQMLPELRVEELALDKCTDTTQYVYRIDLDQVKKQFKQNPPKVVIISQVSHVLGYVLPVFEICKLAKEYHAITIVDATHSLGLIPIDLSEEFVDFLIFDGHHGLNGPVGIGGYFMSQSMKQSRFFVGGAGVSTESNVVCAAGLTAAIEQSYKNTSNRTLDRKATEDRIDDNYIKRLTVRLCDQLSQIKQVKLYIPPEDLHFAIVAFNIEGYRASEVGIILDEEYDICVGTGKLNAPFLHKYLHTESDGVVRASISRFTTSEEIDLFVSAVRQIAENGRS